MNNSERPENAKGDRLHHDLQGDEEAKKEGGPPQEQEKARDSAKEPASLIDWRGLTTADFYDLLNRALRIRGVDDFILCYKEPAGGVVYRTINGDTLWAQGVLEVLYEEAKDINTVNRPNYFMGWGEPEDDFTTGI